MRAKVSTKIIHHPCGQLEVIIRPAHCNDEESGTVSRVVRDEHGFDINIYLPGESQRGVEFDGKWLRLPQKTEFTREAALRIRNAASIIQGKDIGKPLFCTFTIPTEKSYQLKVLQAASGYIANRLTRYLREVSVDKQFVYVWEIQKRGTPHIHLLVVLKDWKSAGVFYRQARAKWRQILLDVSTKSACDMFEARNGVSHANEPGLPVCYFTPIRHSVANYIGKYVSKQKSKSGAENSWFPGRWSGISYNLLKEVDQRTYTEIVRSTSGVDLNAVETELKNLATDNKAKLKDSAKAREYGFVKYTTYCTQAQARAFHEHVQKAMPGCELVSA